MRGQSQWYRYSSDDGNDYRIKVLDYLAEAAGLEPNDSLPAIPKTTTPRSFWLQALVPNPETGIKTRYKLIVQRIDVAKFRPHTLLLIKGTQVEVTSYRGESRSVARRDRRAEAKGT